MKFQTTPIEGLFLIDLEPVADDRGFFARTWCADEFRKQGLDPQVAQASISFNPRRGTLRGMHLQRDPHAEVKLVRCTRGSVQDVVIDLRSASPTHGQWFGVELSADNRKMLYIPNGLAHGYLTLEDGSEFSYQMSTPYHPEAATGVRWDDPAFGVRWQIEPIVIAARDRSYPDYVPGR